MQNPLLRILSAFLALLVVRPGSVEARPLMNLGIQCSNKPEPISQGFLRPLTETDLITLLRKMKKLDTTVPLALDPEMAAIIKAQENSETITWMRLGQYLGHEFALVVLNEYFSAKDAYSGKTWAILVERTPKSPWKAQYVASACTNLLDLIPKEFIVSHEKRVLSFETMARELRIERKDFVITKKGLKELQIGRHLISALKPLTDKGEKFEITSGFNWTTLEYSGRGQVHTDCEACTSGTEVKVAFKWTGEQLKIAKEGVP